MNMKRCCKECVKKRLIVLLFCCTNGNMCLKLNKGGKVHDRFVI